MDTGFRSCSTLHKELMTDRIEEIERLSLRAVHGRILLQVIQNPPLDARLRGHDGSALVFCHSREAGI